MEKAPPPFSHILPIEPRNLVLADPWIDAPARLDSRARSPIVICMKQPDHLDGVKDLVAYVWKRGKNRFKDSPVSGTRYVVALGIVACASPGPLLLSVAESALLKVADKAYGLLHDRPRLPGLWVAVAVESMSLREIMIDAQIWVESKIDTVAGWVAGGRGEYGE